ncbi:aspartyl/asparaginyl beta-hydroxylase domain-containing protein [Brevundimonas sp.]|uniref:aspartyl/asparaginyl beta-hydroxylase domain-containing protein n=1 Tax=Brevundimonas sp. TaxID=1871086 RepID=UPI002FCC900D
MGESRERQSFEARLADADRALAANPRDLRALIAKGDALVGLGDERAGASFYNSALRGAADVADLPPDLAVELRRAQAAIQDQGARFQSYLTDCLARSGFDAATSSDRFSLSLDLMAGRKRLYQQEPRFYLLPGLPQIQFQPRETLPWMSAVEDATADIRTELEALLAEPDLFRPYVEPRADRPNTDSKGMASNADWSALFLWKDGEEQPDMARRCPRTLEALAGVPLCRVPGRTPSILFSRLKAGARIPAHHGLINTRLICHLPLIAPPGSRFRVGNDVREWKEGHAWAFDDTIEHEAVNDSGQDRTILIFDVWKPEVTGEERALMSAMFEAIDGYGAGGKAWGV